MSSTVTTASRAGDGGDQARALTALRWILGFTILSTLLHYTHNFVEVDSYPRGEWIPAAAIQAGVLVSWPLFTAAGLIGYRWFAQRRFPAAQFALLAYSPVGLITVGHFIDGSPEIPAFFYATIFTDLIGGLAVLGFAIWSLRLQRA